MDPESRLFSKALGGGSILDLGCYPLSFVRLVAGIEMGEHVSEPTALVGAAHFGATGVDEWAAATLAFDSGLIAQIHCCITVTRSNSAHLWGDNGSISIASPFLAGVEGQPTGCLTIECKNQLRQTLSFKDAESPFISQIRNITSAILAGKIEADWPGPSWEDTIGNMRALDSWRAAVAPRAAKSQRVGAQSS